MISTSSAAGTTEMTANEAEAPVGAGVFDFADEYDQAEGEYEAGVEGEEIEARMDAGVDGAEDGEQTGFIAAGGEAAGAPGAETGADEVMGPPPVSPSHPPAGAPNGDGHSTRIGVAS